jgi:hypothetical protein
MSKNISICSLNSSNKTYNILFSSRRRYKNIEITKNKSSILKWDIERVKINNPKKVLGLKKPLQIHNKPQKTSPYSRKKGVLQKNIPPNWRKRFKMRLQLKIKSRWPPKVNTTAWNPSMSGRRRLTLSLAQMLTWRGKATASTEQSQLPWG